MYCGLLENDSVYLLRWSICGIVTRMALRQNKKDAGHSRLGSVEVVGWGK